MHRSDASVIPIVAAALAGIVIVAAVVVGAAGFGGGSVTVQQGAPIEIPDDGTAVVVGKSAEGGFELFGIRFHDANRYLQLSAVIPGDCLVRDAAGEEQLRTDGECADLPLAGEVAGGGTTAEGQAIVTVRTPVSPACYDAIADGDLWPSALEECAAP